MPTIWIIFGALMLLSFALSSSLQNKFKRYAKMPTEGGLTGRDVAEKMLHDHGIYDVKITCVKGRLTDHYNPADQTVNLSEDVYYGNGISSAAVAAHECGHAVQHAVAYPWIKLRSALVPPVEFASRWVQWVLLAGILLVEVFPDLLLFGIILFGITTLFSVVTLPVEIDASRRALAWLQGAGVASAQTYPAAKDALRTAAYTYVVAAISSLATLLYYIMIFVGRRD
ncbi:MAG: zinc metallopeptidase [Bacteroidales bacterium]|nr:zinc metallopeptidase [Bacteroidales bacterium]